MKTHLNKLLALDPTSLTLEIMQETTQILYNLSKLDTHFRQVASQLNVETLFESLIFWSDAQVKQHINGTLAFLAKVPEIKDAMLRDTQRIVADLVTTLARKDHEIDANSKEQAISLFSFFTQNAQTLDLLQ